MEWSGREGLIVGTYIVKSIDAVTMSPILRRVHDRSIDLDAVTFDEPRGVLTLPLCVLEYDARSFRKKYGVFKVVDVPIMAAELIFYGVRSYDLLDKSQIGYCMINTITDEGGFILIKGCTDCDFRLYGDRISSELVICDSAVSTKTAFYGFAVPWQ